MRLSLGRALRGGRPGAKSIPGAANEDGTFKSVEKLRALYEGRVSRDKDVIAYCRIGERGSHLVRVDLPVGYPKVAITVVEWGNLVGAPIGKVNCQAN
jgi:thiosulfate/3-mercaptopyruvate sulfurtransferase